MALILIIDDERSIRNTLKEVLEYEKHTILLAESAIEGMRNAKENNLDLVLLDYRLPKSNGIDVLKEIKKDNFLTQVIIITGHGNDNIHKESLKFGAFDFLEKPLDLNGLIISIRKATEHRKELFKNLSEDYIALTLVGNKIKCLRISKDGKYSFFDPNENLYSLIYTFSFESNKLKETIQEFEDLINDENTTENQLHLFFEKNPDFLLADEYKKIHSKIVLSNNENDSLIPDFVLEPFNNKELCDIMELKLPKAKLFTLKKNRFRYSSNILEACAQLREYSLYFDSQANRNEIYSKYGLSLYKPNLILIIGRNKRMDPLEFKKIQLDIPSLHLKTYDDILNKMKRRIK
jgi:DNA-binding response OmpR family regulator